MDLILVILIGVSFLAVLRAFRQIKAQKAHLTETEILDFSKLRMDTYSNEYTRFIGHLSSCEACQERLNAAQKISLRE